jgi:hypothetical protein
MLSPANPKLNATIATPLTCGQENGTRFIRLKEGLITDLDSSHYFLAICAIYLWPKLVETAVIT